jgi:hypothetical protein
MSEDTMSRADAARRLGVTPQRITQLIEKGKLRVTSSEPGSPVLRSDVEARWEHKAQKHQRILSSDEIIWKQEALSTVGFLLMHWDDWSASEIRTRLRELGQDLPDESH